MRILSLKPGHDGAIAYVVDGALAFSIEAEKDSFPRYSSVSASLCCAALEMVPEPPDVIALGGWYKDVDGVDIGVGSGYFGLDEPQVSDRRVLGRAVRWFSSTHERSHVWMAAAMAPGAPLENCAVLVWEGELGAFYHWTDQGGKLRTIPVMAQPGNRWGGLFALADPSFPLTPTPMKNEFAGKLMALAAYGDPAEILPEDRETVEHLLAREHVSRDFKRHFAERGLVDVGVDAPRVRNAAAYLSDRIFETFLAAARRALPRGLPLLIAGGCGLNCDWNTRWAECGYFSDVFVAPCANDSGSAIGTAIDAQVWLGAPCRLDWDVYAGLDFAMDEEPDGGRWGREPLDVDVVARRVEESAVVAWVQGRSEIGPRALGHRSLLATPFEREMRDRLNAIKKREPYRPIAPCCLAEEQLRWFTSARQDPYMLFTTQVREPARIPAVTHVDGSARLQTVDQNGDGRLRSLLRAFASRTGCGVMCNTSLNFPGLGFINTSSDLFRFCETRDIDDVVIGDAHYRRLNGAPAASAAATRTARA